MAIYNTKFEVGQYVFLQVEDNIIFSHITGVKITNAGITYDVENLNTVSFRPMTETCSETFLVRHQATGINENEYIDNEVDRCNMHKERIEERIKTLLSLKNNLLTLTSEE